MMEAIQLDLFDFVAMQAAVQSKVQEVPETVVPRNFQNDGRHGMPTTPAARIEANFKAIRLLKELKAEKRVPSHEEQITLSQFSGWGGLTEVFIEGNRHHQTLKELLSDEEYQTAQNSILDSYYTPEYIIDFMWDIVRKELKIKSGKVAELGVPEPEISLDLRRFRMPMSLQPSRLIKFRETSRRRFIRSQTSGSHRWRRSNCRNSMTS